MPTSFRPGRPVHVSLGAYGRLPHRWAIAEMLSHPPADPVLGQLSSARVQVCPQSAGVFDREMAEEVVRCYPDIEWRLHANVRVENQHRMVDLCDWTEEQVYFRELAQVSAILRAPVYSLHAGRRDKASIGDVLRFAREAEQLFGMPVAIEGHYPTRDHTWLFASWQEYQQLLESGVCYALDLSHLNIVARHSGVVALSLVRDMLACERCLEVHVSGNDGSADQHRPLDTASPPWWLPLLDEAHDRAVIFAEGRLPTISSSVAVAA